jgi:hypothetical protein
VTLRAGLVRALCAVALAAAATAGGSCGGSGARDEPARSAPAATAAGGAGGYRFVGTPLAVIDRGERGAGSGTFEVWFRLNRRLPVRQRRIRARGTLNGAAGEFGVLGVPGRRPCYSQDIGLTRSDVDPVLRDPHPGDRVTFRLTIDGVPEPLEATVPLVDPLPLVRDSRGLGVVDAAYARELGCRRVRR